jgi:hypothetical protein
MVVPEVENWWVKAERRDTATLVLGANILEEE